MDSSVHVQHTLSFHRHDGMVTIEAANHSEDKGHHENAHLCKACNLDRPNVLS